MFFNQKILIKFVNSIDDAGIIFVKKSSDGRTFPSIK